MASKPAVLVTRPAAQAQRLSSQLEDSGFQVARLPMLELVSIGLPEQDQQRLIAQLDQYQHIIFVSSNAVRFGMAWIAPHWSVLPDLPLWHTIGNATAKELDTFGVHAIDSAPGMTTESLLESPALRSVTGQRVLIVKGEGGRVSLSKQLAARGALVDELSCYRRCCPALADGELNGLLRDRDIRLILISSGEGLANLLLSLGTEGSAAVSGIAVIVPSERVAREAVGVGFVSVVTADNASDAAMIRAAQSWWENQSAQLAVENNE